MGRQTRTGWRASRSSGTSAGFHIAATAPKALSRRRLFRNAAGAAAVGAVGGAVLAGTAAPASAAGAAVDTDEDRLAEPGLAPVVVQLKQASTIAVNAALGNDFRVTLTASCTMGNPSHPLDGEKIVFQITQGTGGSFTVTWGSSYHFSASLPRPTLSTTAGETDLLGFIYNAAKAKWLLAAFVKGFS